MSDKIDKVNECLDLSIATSTVAVAIYDLIREVGRGEITADNALHLMIEEYKRLHDITDRLDKLANALEEEEKQKTTTKKHIIPVYKRNHCGDDKKGANNDE